MNQTQSIIIYRNPLEAMFWESGMAFPLGVGLFVFLITFVVLGKILEKQIYRAKFSNTYLFGISVAAAIAGIAAFNMLVI